MTKTEKSLPRTVEDAVDCLVSELPLKEKIRIAKLAEGNLMDLYFSISVDIEDRFCLWENKALVESCRALSGDETLFVEEASYIIISELRNRLLKLYQGDVPE